MGSAGPSMRTAHAHRQATLPSPLTPSLRPRCAQLAFIYVLYKSDLTDPKYTSQSVKQFRQWRRNIAHDITYFDEVTERSLAWRVCTNDQAPTPALAAHRFTRARVRPLMPADMATHGSSSPSPSPLLVLPFSPPLFSPALPSDAASLPLTPTGADVCTSGAQGLHMSSAESNTHHDIEQYLQNSMGFTMLLVSLLAWYLTCGRVRAPLNSILTLILTLSTAAWASRTTAAVTIGRMTAPHGTKRKLATPAWVARALTPPHTPLTPPWAGIKRHHLLNPGNLVVSHRHARRED